MFDDETSNQNAVEITETSENGKVTKILNEETSPAKALNVSNVSTESSVSDTSNINCCVLMRKPIDLILMRYDKVPVDFTNPIVDHSTHYRHSTNTTHPYDRSEMSIQSVLETLGRYLHLRRCIWSTSHNHARLPVSSISRILTILTK